MASLVYLMTSVRYRCSSVTSAVTSPAYLVTSLYDVRSIQVQLGDVIDLPGDVSGDVTGPPDDVSV